MMYVLCKSESFDGGRGQTELFNLSGPYSHQLNINIWTHKLLIMSVNFWEISGHVVCPS